jgi:hypothetical protein
MLVVSSEVPLRDNSRIEALTLTRSPDVPAGDCSRLRTSRGLSISTPLADITRLYPELRHSEAKKRFVFTIDDGTDCISGRSDVLRSFLIVWSERDKAIETIAIEESRGACMDYKAGQSKSVPVK